MSLLALWSSGGAAPADEGQPWQFWQAQDDELEGGDEGFLALLIEDDALWVAELPGEQLEAEPSEDWQQAYIEDDAPAPWLEVLDDAAQEDEQGPSVVTFIEEDAAPVVEFMPDQALGVELEADGYDIDAADTQAFPVGAQPADEVVVSEWITRARRRTRR